MKNRLWNKERLQSRRLNSNPNIVDLLLCTLAGAALAVNVFAGFDARDPLTGSIASIGGVSLLITAALGIIYINRRGKLAAAVLSLAALLSVFWALFQNGAAYSLGRIDLNPALFWTVTVTGSILVFWAARIRAGIVLLFLAGSFLTGVFNLLGYPLSAPAFILFLAAVFALYFCRVGRTSAHHQAVVAADFNEVRSRLNHAVRPVLLSAAVVFLAGSLFYTVVKPLSPPTGEEELAQKLMSMTLMEQLGIATTTIVYTDQPIPPEIQEQDKPEEQKSLEEEKRQNDQKEAGRIGDGLNLVSVVEVTFKEARQILWIAAPAFILLAVMAIPIRMILRKRWYDSTLKKSREEGVLALYSYFLKRFRKMGLKRPQDMTLLEFADHSKETLSKFTVYDADFISLTQIYQKILYGGQQVSEREFELFQDFYMGFRRNLRKEIGSLRYSLKFFLF